MYEVMVNIGGFIGPFIAGVLMQKSWDYVKNNPVRSGGIVIAALIVGTLTTLATKYQILRRRLKLLKQEQVLLLGLMKIVQRECFELAHMGMDEYATAMMQYEERLQTAVEQEVKTETQLAHLGKLKSKKKALLQEKDRLFDLVDESL